MIGQLGMLSVNSLIISVNMRQQGGWDVWRTVLFFLAFLDQTCLQLPVVSSQLLTPNAHAEAEACFQQAIGDELVNFHGCEPPREGIHQKQASERR